MIRKEILIVLATFCLTATLFSIIPVGSQGVREYDPWYDINDDGKIDLKDYFGVGLKYGTYGTAINKTQMLLDLQNRVKTLEEKEDSVKTIRIYTPNETMNNVTDWKDALVFVWNPRNATNNAILSGVLYFCQFSPPSGFTMRVLINENIVVSTGVYGIAEYKQTYLHVISTTYTIMPNQNSYTVKFQIYADHSGDQIYVKDINILLEVMDGLPPS